MQFSTNKTDLAVPVITERPLPPLYADTLLRMVTDAPSRTCRPSLTFPSRRTFSIVASLFTLRDTDVWIPKELPLMVESLTPNLPAPFNRIAVPEERPLTTQFSTCNKPAVLKTIPLVPPWPLI